MVENTKNLTKILICGFMGSGKTTFGGRLKNGSSSYRLLDLDDEVFQKYAKTKGYASLGAFIEGEGWDVFRQAESELLEQTLANKDQLILSLGGGALTEHNLNLIKNSESCLLTLMDTPFEECWSRIKDDENRPLTKHGYSKVEDLYYDRKPIYAQSDCILAPVRQNSLNSVEELLDFHRKMDE